MRRAWLSAAIIWALAVAACGSSPTARPPTPAPRPPPAVDMACVERAKQGTLMSSFPSVIDGFEVTREGNRLTLHRPGRGLLPAEGSLLWTVFSDEYFPKGGLATGSHAQSSVDTCPHASKAGCFHFQLWSCQTSPETLVGWMREATRKRSMDDAELDLVADVLEARGPSCRSDCTPAPQYSKKDATYDPEGARHPVDAVRGGACEVDGDCEGADRNNCTAWYLSGGVELAVFIQVSEPTFCGCVDHACTWFTQ